MILKFASHYIHNKLYTAYDTLPELWKPSLWSHCVDRPLSFEGYADNWSDKQWNDHTSRVTTRIRSIDCPFDIESCDYWCDQRFRKAIKYTKHASCQWMSRANYQMAIKVMPNHDWFHVADNDMNDGATHHYVVNNNGEILDPQGLALGFDLADYQKSFKTEMVSPHHEVMEILDDLEDDYAFWTTNPCSPTEG